MLRSSQHKKEISALSCVASKSLILSCSWDQEIKVRRGQLRSEAPPPSSWPLKLTSKSPAFRPSQVHSIEERRGPVTKTTLAHVHSFRKLYENKRQGKRKRGEGREGLVQRGSDIRLLSSGVRSFRSSLSGPGGRSSSVSSAAKQR